MHAATTAFFLENKMTHVLHVVGWWCVRRTTWMEAASNQSTAITSPFIALTIVQYDSIGTDPINGLPGPGVALVIKEHCNVYT